MLPFKKPLNSIINQYRKSHSNLQVLYRDLWLDMRATCKHCHSLDLNSVSDYDGILRVWGVAQDEVNKTKISFILGIILNLALSALCAVTSIRVENVFIYVQLWAIVLLSVFTIICLFWKLWILRNKRFVSFWHWMSGRW